MSKVSFRARALDVSKPMPIYRTNEIPDIHDYDKINRAVVQMPTGMEKEEEMETHLQKALNAQVYLGSAELHSIPIPEVDCVDERYHRLYLADYKLPKQYIHVEALGMEHEIPDYDLDSEDECWLQEQTKKMEINGRKFEEMMDRLEKGSGQQVVTLQEAKLLLKEDDDLIIAVYDYWLNKRLRLEMPLIPTIKTEKRDGTTTNNPYVAFRRRTEKMQTRKNRKNDEVSYEKMLKLKRDMIKALNLTTTLKRREKSKKEILQLTLEIMEKRYQMGDFSGTMLAEAEAERAKMPSFIPPFMFNSQTGMAAFNGEEVAPVRKKRQYRRRQKQQTQQPSRPNHPMAAALASVAAAASSFGDVDVLHHHDMDSSEEDMMSPALSPSDHEDEHDPDGPFAFKRRKMCNYHAPLYNRLGNWPWAHPQEGGKGDKRFRFSLSTLPGGRCIGYARRRVGRGGRVVLDRAYTPWDDGLEKLNLTSGQSFSGVLGDYITHIRERKIPYYRPPSPPTDEDSSDDGMYTLSSSHRHQASSTTSHRPTATTAAASSSSQSVSHEFTMDSFRTHREQLLAMHLEQEALRLSQDSATAGGAGPSSSNNHNNNLSSGSAGLSCMASDLGYSFSSQPTSRFTLDSASAKFAVTAVVDSAQLESKRATAAASTTTVTTTSTQATASVAGRVGVGGEMLVESLNHVRVVGAAGDMGLKVEKVSPSSAAVVVAASNSSSSSLTIPTTTTISSISQQLVSKSSLSSSSSSLPSLSSLSSLSSSSVAVAAVASSPVVLSSLPAIMAPKAVVGLSSSSSSSSSSAMAVAASPSPSSSSSSSQRPVPPHAPPKAVLSALSFTPSTGAVPSSVALAHAAVGRGGGTRLSNGPLGSIPAAPATTVGASLIPGRAGGVGPSVAATIVQLPLHHHHHHHHHHSAAPGTSQQAPALRAVVPVPTPTPVVTASATSGMVVQQGSGVPVSVVGVVSGGSSSSGSGGGGSSSGNNSATSLSAMMGARDKGKGNKVVLASGSTPMCSMASAPLAILKSGQEEGKSNVHRFTADTPMPMDVS